MFTLKVIEYNSIGDIMLQVSQKQEFSETTFGNRLL